ncbi:TetR/AcrR family transcriptional regulator [Cellulomonas chengniuliangii]|uniref:TetR/AcrR family transcriptional regulator n=1 Tax=Cellulomonas chengniuliangii TaxID=2968084 RepID=A0ABY5L470_9CELL|nr:TetR/AcrR family transcriptional regulator [Cellulomonas chengniuliangii]MCC2309811.1 TetR/AcrR family transcriptional regulator [Cellulomonas chengniuliangii]MCC2318068.1 TetR/AcrR family transcriptional regulator [Cellulomonas chengniuliangii]UUI76255.1 TetR/AcrR family transcriptional regulator [Cellulomonas chengniuliangii]
MKNSSVQDSVKKAAVDLFATQGYATTSVQQIVEAAGVTKGAMYHYFRSKDDLLFAIYEQLLTLQGERLSQIVDSGLPTQETLRAVCVDVIETSIDYLPEGTVFFRSVHMLSDERQEEVKRRRRKYHDDFSSIIERGQREGVYRADVPRAVLVAHFFSDVHYLSHWYSPAGPESKGKIAAQITDLFLDSLSADAPARRR